MKKKTIKSLFLVLALITVIIGVSFALLRFNIFGAKINNIIVEGMTFSYNEGDNQLSLLDAEPMPDEKGIIQSNYFDFNINFSRNTISSIPYVIYITKSDSNTIADSNVKIYLTDENDNQIVAPTLISNLNNYTKDTTNRSFKLYNTSIATTADVTKITQNYRLRIWIDNNAIYNPNYSAEGDIISGSVGDEIFSFTVNVAAVTK